MKLETFFEKFDQFADAPDAVEELRKIILHLAVHGSLVEQSDEDEPASEMLQRLSELKPSLLDSADLPTAWASVALGDLLALQKGKKPNSLNIEGVGLPYLDIAALERGELRQFTEDEKCPRAVPGDLVIVCDGSRSGLVLDGVAGVLGSTVSKIGYAGFVRDYLKLFLRSLYEDLNGAKKGAAIPHLNIPRLLAIPAPIPPLAEQKRIVAKVDELMALCDRLEVQQQERETRHAALARASLARFADAPTSANLQFLFHPSYPIPPADLRKSIFTLAIQGKLVPQDPNDEPASCILHQVQVEKGRGLPIKSLGSKRRFHTSPEVEIPFEVPNNWEWSVLEELALFTNGKAHEQIVDPNGKYVLVNSRFVSTGGIRKKYAREILTPLSVGDVALVMSDVPDGRALGRCFVIDKDNHYTLNQRIGAIRMFGKIEPRFAYLVLDRNPHFLGFNDGKKQTNLKKSQIVSCPFPVPPLAEQRRIVAKVDQLMTLVDQLETQLAASRATGANLVDAIVSELAAAA